MPGTMKIVACHHMSKTIEKMRLFVTAMAAHCLKLWALPHFKLGSTFLEQGGWPPC